MTDKILSFFSGAGFLDLGFEKAGFEILYANEIHKPFIDGYIHARNKMKLPLPKYGIFQGPIQECFNEEEFDKITKIINRESSRSDRIGFIGGPPCPDFSIGGKNRGKEGVNGVLSSIYIDLICKLKPDFFVFENVKGLTKTIKHKLFFEEIKQKLIINGYILNEKLVNAIEFGVPQDRNRIILFGINKKLLTKKGPPTFDWELEQKFNQQEVFNYKWPNNGESILKKYKTLTVQYWFNKNKVEQHPNFKHVFQPKAALSKFQTIVEGDNSKKSFKRLHRFKYSPTAAYGNNEVHIHPTEARRITVSEALAIQSLPKEFEFPSNMTLTNMFKTIGNGVPFLLSLGLARSIKKYLMEI